LLQDVELATPYVGLVQVEHDYHAAGDNQLELRGGEIIWLIDRGSSGWWKGEIDGRTGFFPYTYVSDYVMRRRGTNNKGA